MAMGITKSELFSEEQNYLADLARALGHPARIAIIQHLLKENTCINSDLVQELGLAQATISQHLKELKDVDIIQGSIEGAKISYCINPVRWVLIKHRFNEFFNQFPDPAITDCC